jgi:type IV fimbrial biogenesis protein FimT
VVGHGRGYTLMEMMVTMTIAGIMMSMAVPRMEAFIRRERVRGAANRLAVDLAYTRMLAMRNGSSAVLRFTPDPRCPYGVGAGYRIGLRGRVAALRTQLAEPGATFCYDSNGSDTVVFNSRGILAPFNNRTIRVADGNAKDSLTLSVAGRIFVRR